MKWLLIATLFACTNSEKPDLTGTYPCETMTCDAGQICVTYETGLQCGMASATMAECIDIPASCNGLPSCDCVTYQGNCQGAEDRSVMFAC